jgi:hypothetical protein
VGRFVLGNLATSGMLIEDPDVKDAMMEFFRRSGSRANSFCDNNFVVIEVYKCAWVNMINPLYSKGFLFSFLFVILPAYKEGKKTLIFSDWCKNTFMVQ